MNKLFLGVLGVFFLNIFPLNKTYAQAFSADFNPSQVYLKVKEDVSLKLPLFSNAETGELEDFPTFKVICDEFSVNEVQQALKTRSKTLDKIYKITFDELHMAHQLLFALKNLNYIEYAEAIPYDKTSYTPNDLNPAFYHFYIVDALQAWDISQGSEEVVVAIVDDAVLTSHEDLAANMWINEGEIPGNLMDDDGNGWIDDYNGYDVANNDGDPNPPNNNLSHGTHVAGISCAVTDNDLGVPSLGFKAKIMAAKATLDNNNSGTLDNTVDGIDYAVANSANVVNMSFGSPFFLMTTQLLINEGHSKGMIFVAAAGNDNAVVEQYPADYSNVISVGSTNSQDQRSGFSNFGENIDVMAPGSLIFSTMASGGYALQSGTSMSSPYVAGLCALMFSVNPDMDPQTLEDCLLSSCDNIDAQNPAYVGLMGAGRVNAYQALQCLPQPVRPVALFTSLNTDACGGVVQFQDSSENFTSSWHWDFGDGQIGSGKNPAHAYDSSGTYTVTLIASNSAGSDTSSIQVTVNYLPLPPLSVMDDTSGCIYDQIQLLTSGASSYEWTPTTGLNNPNLANPILTIQTTQTYTVTTLGSNGCPNSDTIHVEMFPLPNTQAGQDVVIDYGDSIQLNASGADYFVWSPGTGLSCTECPSPMASPESTTWYYVTGFNSFGCGVEDEIGVYVNPGVGRDILPSEKIAVNIWPNPAQDYLKIDLSGSSLHKAVIELFSTDGRKVKSKSYSTASVSGEIISYPLEGIPAGLYFVNVKQGDQTAIHKLLIAK